MQTALIGLLQLLITVVLAQIWLEETLSFLQWIGAVVLVLAIIIGDRGKARPKAALVRGWLYWLRPPLQLLGKKEEGATSSLGVDQAPRRNEPTAQREIETPSSK
jgi:hypothetical protein